MGLVDTCRRKCYYSTFWLTKIREFLNIWISEYNTCVLQTHVGASAVSAPFGWSQKRAWTPGQVPFHLLLQRCHDNLFFNFQNVQKKMFFRFSPRFFWLETLLSPVCTRLHCACAPCITGGGGGGAAAGVYSYSSDIVEGRRAPAVKLTAQISLYNWVVACSVPIMCPNFIVSQLYRDIIG